MPRMQMGRDGRTEVSLSYQDFGEGRPVVLVSGWPLTQSSWEGQVGAFVAAGHRVVTFDRRGFGGSTRAWDGHDGDTLAGDLHRVLEQLDLQEVSLVGFSSGCGDITRYLATNGADRVESVVLASPIVVMCGDELVADLRAAAHRHRIPMLDGVLTRFFSVDGECALDEPTRRHLLHLASCASPRATGDAIGAWPDGNRQEDLDQVTVPALVMHGACDAFMPFEASGAAVARAVPDGRTAVLPQAPHGAHVTHPHQWNRAVLGFLSA